MAKPRSGKFDRRITIEISTPSRDESGDLINNWTFGFKLFAHRLVPRPTSVLGQEAMAEQAVLHRSQVNWILRYGTKALSIAPETHRIRYKGRVYQILSIVEGQGRQEEIVVRTATTPDQRGTMAPEASSG
jgi:SPP1 family predicted phage head-tail adaptor|tara:strand:+ start:3832 stop:4224 length:393 start_codon:yes stop_codon:yes gene_type:complete